MAVGKRMLTVHTGQGSGKVGLFCGSDQWGCYEAGVWEEGSSCAAGERCACQGWKEIVALGAWRSKYQLAQHVRDGKVTNIAQTLYTICYITCKTHNTTCDHLYICCISL